MKKLQAALLVMSAISDIAGCKPSPCAQIPRDQSPELDSANAKIKAAREARIKSLQADGGENK